MLPAMMTGSCTRLNCKSAAIATRQDLRTLILTSSLGLIGILLLMSHSGVLD